MNIGKYVELYSEDLQIKKFLKNQIKTNETLSNSNHNHLGSCLS